MGKFYLLLWLKWILRISLCSIGLALFITLTITIALYINQNMPPLNSSIVYALFDIVKFWFPIVWSFTLLIALFRSIKYLFNKRINNFELQLLDCKYREKIEFIGYGDLVKVWRKWFMLLIWLVVIEMILSTILIDEWFNIYWLFIAILVAGYFSFVLLGNRCKRINITNHFAIK